MNHSFFDDDDNTSLPAEYQPAPDAGDNAEAPTAEENTEIDNDAAVDDGTDFYSLPTERRSFIWSLLSVLLSLLSVLLCSVYALGIALSVCAIAFAFISARRLGFFDKMALFGLIVAIFGAVFGIFAMVIDITGVLDGLIPSA